MTHTDNPTPEQLAARRRWVAKLREGKYRKTKGQLASASGQSRCCLGVACDSEVIGIELDTCVKDSQLLFDGYGAFLPRRVADVLGLDRYPGVTLPRDRGGFAGGRWQPLAVLNDSDKDITHEQLADYIEAEYITPFDAADKEMP